ncbi:MAG TPA: carbon-nitrogen hydrolase family protein [Bryobacteraceae bacterium]|nr:carbon-nitrogen hydrolase family protein [Bryobacteraceae bacterium]
MSLIIAAAQSRSIPGDVPQNVFRHMRLATMAAEQGVQLLVFPELSLTGYELSLAHRNAVRPDSSLLDPLRMLAKQACMTVVAGAPVPNEEGELYIAALAFGPDESVVVYAKEYVHESELGVFVCGPGGPTLRVQEAAVALAICADAKHPEHAGRAAARGADIYAAGVMITEEDYPKKVDLLSNYAAQHRMAVLMANYSGWSGGLESAGKSAIWSEAGAVVAASTGTEEALVVGARAEGAWKGMIFY